MTEGFLEDDGMCFGCGPQNEIGLQLNFAWDGDTYATRWTPAKAHQGWADRVHGGLLALVLDETLSRAAHTRHGLFWVTAELTTRLIKPALVNQPLRVQARIQSARRRLIICTGEVVDEQTNATVATGLAKMMPVK